MVGSELIAIGLEFLSELPELLDRSSSVLDNKYIKRAKIRPSNLKLNSITLNCITFIAHQLLNLETVNFNSFLNANK